MSFGSVETVREKPKDGFLSLVEQEAHSARSGSVKSETPITVTTSVDQKISPYGQWKAVEDPALHMPDLQLPVTEADADEEEHEEALPAEQAEEIIFEEKVVEKKISNGNDCFKKRQVRPAARRNVRKRDSSP